MAACDIGSAVQNVKLMLSNLTAWKAICGVSTATEAATRIHEYGIEEDEDTPTQCPLIILDVEDSGLEWKGGHMNGPLGITVRLELEIPASETETYSKQGIWFWSKWSAILDGINSGVQGSGGLMLERITTLVKPGRIEPDSNGGRCEWMAVLNLELHLQ